MGPWTLTGKSPPHPPIYDPPQTEGDTNQHFVSVSDHLLTACGRCVSFNGALWPSRTGLPFMRITVHLSEEIREKRSDMHSEGKDCKSMWQLLILWTAEHPWEQEEKWAHTEQKETSVQAEVSRLSMRDCLYELVSVEDESGRKRKRNLDTKWLKQSVNKEDGFPHICLVPLWVNVSSYHFRFSHAVRVLHSQSWHRLIWPMIFVSNIFPNMETSRPSYSLIGPKGASQQLVLTWQSHNSLVKLRHKNLVREDCSLVDVVKQLWTKSSTSHTGIKRQSPSCFVWSIRPPPSADFPALLPRHHFLLCAFRNSSSC